MAYAGVLEDIRKCVGGGAPERLPVFACSEEMDVRLSPYTYEQFCGDAKIMAEVMIGAVKRFDYDWAWLQIDDCFIVENLGVKCKGEGDILRATIGYLPAEVSTLQSLPKIDVRKAGRCPVLLEAVRRIKDEFGDSLCVCGHVEAPFSAVGLLYGLDTTMIKMIDDPPLLHESMKVLAEIEAGFAVAQIEAGADAIWLGDCNASSHLMSVQMYRDFAAEPCRQVIDAIQGAGGWTFLHNSEESPASVVASAELGPSAVSVGPGGDMVAMREAVGPAQCLMGNVDPILVLERGTPEDVERQARALIDNVSIGGAHLMNSGEMVPRDTPEGNIDALIRTTREYWAEKTQA